MARGALTGTADAAGTWDQRGSEGGAAWDQRPGALDAARFDGAPLVVGHRDRGVDGNGRGWLVRMIAGGLTFDMTREDARALRDDLQLTLDAIGGRFGGFDEGGGAA